MSFYSNCKNRQKEPETSKVGVLWTSDEDTQLIQEIGENKSIEEIAKIHQRMTGGIESRIRHLAAKLANEGKLVEEISNILNISIESINYAVEKRKRRESKKDKPTFVKVPEPTVEHTEEDTLNDIKYILQDIKDCLMRIEDNMSKRVHTGNE